MFYAEVGWLMFQQILVEGIMNGAIIALVAIGIALIWGVMGILNFAQGEFMMLGMYIAYFAKLYFDIDPIFMLPVSMIILYFFGVFTYKAFVCRILEGPAVAQRLLTFALSMVYSNVAMIAFGAEYKTLQNLMISGTFQIGNVTLSWTKVVPFLVCIVLVVLLQMFLNHTRMGKAIQATSQDRDAAQLVGVDFNKTYTTAFGISAAITGAAGCVLTYYFYLYPSVGSIFLLFAFISVAMGGLGSIVGALAGGILMGIVDVTTGFYVNTAFKYLAVCLLYVLVASLRPKGLFGR